MKKILQKYCSENDENGLLLLDMPTGSGKTYNVLEYIFEEVQKENNDKKYFFVTTLKKNLPIEELKNRFKKVGKQDLFEDKFIFIDSNFESVLSGFNNPDFAKSIPAEIQKLEEYKNLRKYIIGINRGRETGNNREFLNILENDFRQSVEPKFRSKIQKELKKRFKTADERRNAVRDKDWNWVGALYPTVFLKEKQIIFMSMDKFLTRCTTIVESSFMLYNSSFIENSVVFIDEFDATKSTMLNSIISNGLNDSIDYIDLFNCIYSSLGTHTFPISVTLPSQRQLEGKYGDSLQEIINSFREKAKEIHEKYNLDLSHKTDSSPDDNVQNFLFQDHRYHSILNGNNTFIYSETNNNDKINYIKFSQEKQKNSESNIQSMLGNLRGFVTYFLNGIRILAENYQQRKNETRKVGEDEFSFEEAIRSILTEFGLNTTYINSLTSTILFNSRSNKNSDKVNDMQSNDGFDLSFYEKGFRFYSFEDDYSHDTMSKIMMHSFQITPEKLLLKICEKAKVVGISATATLESVIGNYDLEYIRQCLDKKYFILSEDEKEILNNQFDSSIRGYEEGAIKLNIKIINGKDNSIPAWAELFNDNKEYDERIRSIINNQNVALYDEIRYFKISSVFKDFLLHKDINSLLCVLNKHPRKGDPNLDLDLIKQFFELIVNFYEIKFNLNENLVQLDGNEFDKNKERIIKRLSAGEKLFVISVYQTIGAGQNLQYKIPYKIKNTLVKSNDRPEDTHKDFDAIYLDRPTNLVVNIDRSTSQEELTRYIFQIEMLQENGEISHSNAFNSCIKAAFRTVYGRNYFKNTFKISNLKSVKSLLTKAIIQAVGRICRTNMKSKNIYVFADSEIGKSLDYSCLEGRHFNPEFSYLVKRFNKINETNGPEEEKYKIKADSVSSRCFHWIASILERDYNDYQWNDVDIRRWTELREYVLRNPTLSIDEYNNRKDARSFYITLPKKANIFYYRTNNDYKTVETSFLEKVNYYQVSENSARLVDVMKVKEIEEYFIEKGYATKFLENDTIMCPTLFNNIYRGALGEVVGKFIFEKYYNIKLVPIEDKNKFELFDFKIENTDIYVDFKNWNLRDGYEKQNQINKIINKAKKCNARIVVIANMFANTDSKQINKQSFENIKIITIPNLIIGDRINTLIDEKLHMELSDI